jgi:hypothetical protein
METTRWGIEQSDAVTTVSAALRNATRDIFGITRPIEVVPNFIDPTATCASPAAPARGAGRSRASASRAHLQLPPVKRVDDVVEVFHRLRGASRCAS